VCVCARACAGVKKTVEVELGEARQYIAEGVAETEAAGDKELCAEFLWHGVQLNIAEGFTATDCVKTLQVRLSDK
jgi:hypothetical protein